MPRCKYHKTKFEAKYFLQKYCLKDDECIDAELKERAEKLAAKEQKPKAKIPRRSKKRLIQELQYNANVKVFLGKPENQICPVTGHQTDQVHHKKGRIESLLLDQRYWLAVSDEGHREIELNPDWAKEMGYSLSRLENLETT